MTEERMWWTGSRVVVAVIMLAMMVLAYVAPILWDYARMRAQESTAMSYFPFWYWHLAFTLLMIYFRLGRIVKALEAPKPKEPVKEPQ